MATGTVRWFSLEKKFGFVLSDNPPEDIFIHISALHAAGLESLRDGQRISFVITIGKNGKKQASQIAALAEPDRVQRREYNDRPEREYRTPRAPREKQERNEYDGCVTKKEFDDRFMSNWRKMRGY